MRASRSNALPSSARKGDWAGVTPSLEDGRKNGPRKRPVFFSATIFAASPNRLRETEDLVPRRGQGLCRSTPL